MFSFKKIFYIFLFVILSLSAHAQVDTRIISSEPKEIYGKKNAEIKIRIGNGGAGITGILRALSEDYLKVSGNKFAIAWYQDISINTLQQLKTGNIDIALVYERSQNETAQKEGWGSNYTRIFNDHFLVVGPKRNPARLEESDSPVTAFKKIYANGEKNKETIFLSRDDNSATNVKEQSIWQAANLKPWNGNKKWYYKYHVFPKDALLYADKNALYTVTDHGTWLANKNSLSNTKIYVSGNKSLINPCFALLGENPSKEALAFLNYLKSDRAQKLIANFGKGQYDGQAFFTPAQQLDF